MAYVAITSAEITTGEATSNTTATKIKDNFIDHESRILAVETGRKVPLVYELQAGWAGTTGAFYEKLRFQYTLTAIKVWTISAGGAGVHTIDVLRGTGGPFTSILSTPITVSNTQYTDVSGTIITSVLSADDFIQINTTSGAGTPRLKIYLIF